MDNNDLKKLANTIKQARISKNLTQEDLAIKCDFDRTYISMLECAKRNPSYLNLLKLCNGLEIKLSELLRDNENK